MDPRRHGGRMNARTTEDIVEVVDFDGREWLYLRSIPVDVAIIRATTADEFGNLSLRGRRRSTRRPRPGAGRPQQRRRRHRPGQATRQGPDAARAERARPGHRGGCDRRRPGPAPDHPDRLAARGGGPLSGADSRSSSSRRGDPRRSSRGGPARSSATARRSTSGSASRPSCPASSSRRGSTARSPG